MDTNKILALYDEEERRTIEYPGLRREETPHIIRHVDLLGTNSLVLFSCLNINNADTIIDEQILHFEELGHDFEWKYYEHDSPPDLKSRLETKGFEIGEMDSIVALDLEDIPEPLTRPATHDLRKITDPNEMSDLIAVQHEVWKTDPDSPTLRQIAYEMKNEPDSISVYVAFADSQPVASAWIRFTSTSQFASLWAGSTIPAYRHRGFYTALLAIRTQEALKRGKRFVTVDAGEMSLPILKNLGFQLVTTSNPCEWRCTKRGSSSA